MTLEVYSSPDPMRFEIGSKIVADIRRMRIKKGTL